jgi:hypothetical protein
MRPARPGHVNCGLTFSKRLAILRTIPTARSRSSYRFPHCVVNGLMAGDLTFSVRFKPIAGGVDRAAGLVWRYRDPDSCYVVRANALEGNVVTYKVEKGKRTDLLLKGAGRTYAVKASVPSGAWSALEVVPNGKFASRAPGYQAAGVGSAGSMSSRAMRGPFKVRTLIR